MEYTHYFSELRLDDKLVDDARRIIDTADITLCGWDGEGFPVVSDDLICFNGDASSDDDGETFSVSRLDGKTSGFCKTGRRPYDDVVVAILIAAVEDAAPGFESISSDGSLLEWLWGLDLYENACGKISDETAGKLGTMLRLPRTSLFSNKICCRDDIFRAQCLFGIDIDLSFSIISMCNAVNFDSKIVSYDVREYWNCLGMGKVVFDPDVSVTDRESGRAMQRLTKDLHKIWVNYAAKIKDELLELPPAGDFEELRKRMEYVARKTNVENAIDALLSGVPADDIVAG